MTTTIVVFIHQTRIRANRKRRSLFSFLLPFEQSETALVRTLFAVGYELAGRNPLRYGLKKRTRSLAKPEKITTITLRACVESLLQLAHYQIPESIVLRVNIPGRIIVRLPEAGTRQAILNLLLNAAHAIGSVPGEIVVGAHCDESRFSIYVQDSGPGFSDDMLRNGIRPYDSHRCDGAGLGLVTVRRFAQGHDGMVKLANAPNGGGVVTIIFPKDKVCGL